MSNHYQKISYLLGLIPPDNKAMLQEYKHYGIKVESPSALEVELAMRKHRWNEMQKLQEDFFSTTGKIIVGAEIDALKIFGLPDIDQIRRSLEPDFEDPKLDNVSFTANQFVAHKRVVSEVQEALIGDDKIVTKKEANPEQLSVFDHMLLTAFGISTGRTLGQLKKVLPPDFDVDEFDRTAVLPQIRNNYLRGVIDHSGDRIKTELGQKHIVKLKNVLNKMAREGKSPYQMGRLLHKLTGEGELWYWLRLTRSEAILAVNAGFNAQTKASGAEFEEWSAAGNACPICQAFHGRMWKIGDGPEPVESTHPHCVIGTTKVMTPNGFMSIKEIKLNDLVLSHNGKFRKVTKLHRHQEANQKMIKIGYLNPQYSGRKVKNEITLKITDNHPIWLNGKWQNAINTKVGDKIKILAKRCPVCNKLMPYSRWRTVHGKEANFCSLDCSNKVMDNWVHRPKEETKQIRKKISDFKKINNPMHDNDCIEKMRKSKVEYYKQPGIKEAQSKRIKKFHAENPDFTKKYIEKWKKENPEKYKKTKKKQGESLRRFYQKYPEKHPNRTMCNVSKPQKALYNLIIEFFKNAILEMPIKTSKTVFYADIAIPEYKIIIEYDGSYWHRDKEKDLRRDLELAELGWTTIRFTKDNWQTAPKQIKRVLKNHKNEYEFIEVIVSDIKEEIKTNIKLFNLSVDVDESYIAKGFVVHNCLCVRVARFIQGNRPIQPTWNQPSPYDQFYTADELRNLPGRDDVLSILNRP